MRIYLAARYGRRVELLGYKAQLEAQGHTVTSRWLLKEERVNVAGAPVTEDGQLRLEEAQRFASECVDDVARAHLLIAFTEEPRSPAGGVSRGGRHVEMGLALALGRYVIVAGPRENLFCWLGEVYHADVWAAVLPILPELRLSAKRQ